MALSCDLALITLIVTMKRLEIDFNAEYLRSHIVGADTILNTPFGERLMLYADYTASGRALDFVEDYLRQLQIIYANTHTEDDTTGRTMTSLLHQAEESIKRQVNAGEQGLVIATGSGATGAIQKMQQIIGVQLCPATRLNQQRLMQRYFGMDAVREYQDYLVEHQPVVFVGPYEHHSNEVSWRESLATVIEVRLDDAGGIDIQHLADLLQDPLYQGRLRIGSFSAASNVTGRKTPVHEIAALLHRHDALAFFDYAASAPYVPIDMNPEGYADDASLDAIFISAHKFIGGPGASGVLVFNRRCYQSNIPPTVAGGGTVDFVGPSDHDFIKDIETREKAGTPGILQTLKAALAFEIKAAIGAEAIEAREAELLERAFDRWNANPRIEILGNRDTEKRVGIVSFNLKTPHGAYLHPRFVTTLLDDLFGIQSRAGCSCAGPYGHILLGIDSETASRYRHWILRGYEGIKPGWCRVGFHYTFDDAEANYLIDAVDFVARFGHRFLPLYDFDVHTGAWNHRNKTANEAEFSLQQMLSPSLPNTLDNPGQAARQQFYQDALRNARSLVEQELSGREIKYVELSGELTQLQFFALCEDNLPVASLEQMESA